MTASERLAAEAIALRDGGLPPDVCARAVDLLRDFMGVAIGGAVEESTVTLRRALARLGTAGDATVLGASERTAPAHAAIANGAAAHALEMDDTHQGGSIHLGTTMFPAALAAAELAGAGGALLLPAVVAGYEVAARLAMALGPAAHYKRGFHLTGTCGAFGAAVTAGLVLGLDRPALTNALGVAGSQTSGSMEFLADGAWTKRLHPGWAASAGLYAAMLAAEGFRAPATIVEGRFGFLHAYSDGAAPLAAQDGFELMRTSIKPHACCRYMQGPIDATLALRREHAIDPSAVEHVDVGMLAAGVPIVSEPASAKQHPQSEVDAQFSLPFGVAVALVRGAASPAEFAPAALADARVRSLMERVASVGDPTLDAVFPRIWPSWVRITLRGGRIVEQRVEHPRGDPENFPSPAELDAKFRLLAGRVLGPNALDRLSAAIDALPRADTASALLLASRPSVT